jgi:hypothetical protein
MDPSERDYDVAVTFAGEDREYVEEVVAGVKAAGFSVFYDEDNPAELWGEELTEYFPKVYEERARYAVMFISKHYAAKSWTRLERRSVLLRAMEQSSPYLLPVRLDSTALPGVRETIGFLDGLRLGPQGIIDAIEVKLGNPASTGERQFNGLAPRTSEELVTVFGERPNGWSYLAFSYFLVENIAKYSPEYDDHLLEFVLPGDYLPDDEVLSFNNEQIAKMQHLTDSFERLLSGPAQTQAMGSEGVEPDPDKIEQLAARLGDIYAEMLRWQSQIRSRATHSDSARQIIQVFAHYADQPIEAMRHFASTYRDVMDGVTARIEAGENIELDLTIKFAIPYEVIEALNAARDRFAREVLGIEA